jgi:hypothetical protein
MTSPSAPTSKPTRSLLGFYIGLGVVAVTVGLVVWLAPTGRLHYHAWRYQKTRSLDHFMYVANVAISQRMSKESVTALLGRPAGEGVDEDSVYYIAYSTCDQPRSNPDTGFLDSMPIFDDWRLKLGDGHVVRIEPFNEVGHAGRKPAAPTPPEPKQ